MATWSAGAGDETNSVERISIAEAIADTDADFVPDGLGDRVIVQGILTSDPLAIGRRSALVNLQDESGGVALYSRSPSKLINRVKAGDEVVAIGVVGQYEGAEQIILEEIEFVREATIPEPMPVSTRDFTDETYAGQLVKIRGRVEVLDRRDGDNVRAVLRDTFGQINLFIPSRFYGEPAFVRRLLSISEIEVVGIVSQADSEAPFSDGYRLIPRTTADLAFFPDPPYVTVLVSVSVSLLLIASLMLWKSRRASDKAARGMSQLTRDLKHSESQLRENETQIRLLTQQVPAIVWSVDKTMHFTSSAGAGLKVLNLKQDEVRAIGGARLWEQTGEH